MLSLFELLYSSTTACSASTCSRLPPVPRPTNHLTTSLPAAACSSPVSITVIGVGEGGTSVGVSLPAVVVSVGATAASVVLVGATAASVVLVGATAPVSVVGAGGWVAGAVVGVGVVPQAAMIIDRSSASAAKRISL